jgi:hypothetical protein
MNKPVGGRGQKATYETEMCRIPKPIKEHVKQIKNLFYNNELEDYMNIDKRDWVTTCLCMGVAVQTLAKITGMSVEQTTKMIRTTGERQAATLTEEEMEAIAQTYYKNKNAGINGTINIYI